ncbi:MAG: hypothetical protein PVJ86_03505, partial [Phycisphaerales bacterium]
MPATKPITNSKTSFATSLILFAATAVLPMPVSAFEKTVAEWDFSKGLQGWTGNSRVEDLSYSPEGLIVKSTGQDPWIEGPAVDLPSDKIVRVRIRMKSSADTSGELFYGTVFGAGDSVRFTARNDGQWHNYCLIIRDELGRGTRFRLDPCMGQGEVTIAFIRAEAISKIVVPSLEKPREPDRTKGSLASIKSGRLEFEHYGGAWGNFALEVNGVATAAGYEHEMIGLVFDDCPEWLNLSNAAITFDNQRNRKELAGKAVIEDSKGGRWEIRKRIRPGKRRGTLEVEVELEVNKDRDVIHIPCLTIFPGLG